MQRTSQQWFCEEKRSKNFLKLVLSPKLWGLFLPTLRDWAMEGIGQWKSRHEIHEHLINNSGGELKNERKLKSYLDPEIHASKIKLLLDTFSSPSQSRKKLEVTIVFSD
jgi:hypothetical protein